MRPQIVAGLDIGSTVTRVAIAEVSGREADPVVRMMGVG